MTSAKISKARQPAYMTSAKISCHPRSTHYGTHSSEHASPLFSCDGSKNFVSPPLNALFSRCHQHTFFSGVIGITTTTATMGRGKGGKRKRGDQQPEETATQADDERGEEGKTEDPPPSSGSGSQHEKARTKEQGKSIRDKVNCFIMG